MHVWSVSPAFPLRADPLPYHLRAPEIVLAAVGEVPLKVPVVCLHDSPFVFFNIYFFVFPKRKWTISLALSFHVLSFFHLAVLSLHFSSQKCWFYFMYFLEAGWDSYKKYRHKEWKAGFSSSLLWFEIQLNQMKYCVWRHHRGVLQGRKSL